METVVVLRRRGQLTFFCVKNANPVSLGLGTAAAALLCLFAAACGSSQPAAAQANKTVFDHFTIGVGGHPASLQVAVSEAEQERGLMQRPDLGGDDGMLFVYAEPQSLSIWMRNTPEPLDLAYLTEDGAVAEVYSLLPLDERPVTSHTAEMQYALEMPKGWLASHGVRVGDRIDLKAVAAALKDRGFDPAKYRLGRDLPAP